MMESQDKQLLSSGIKFYPIPHGSTLILQSKEFETINISKLVNLLMHLSIEKPDLQVQYWLQLEGEE